MAQQPDHKPTLVLMAGLPGAGKTTLAVALGHVLQWTVLDKDLLKLSLLNLQLGMPEEETGRIAYELLFVLAEDMLVRQRSSIILDTSAHRLFILEHSVRIAHTAGAQMKTILCTASSDLRRVRLNSRVAPTVHHSFMNSMDTITIENDLERFKHLPEDRLIIQTYNPLKECLEQAIHYLLQPEKILNQ